MVFSMKFSLLPHTQTEKKQREYYHHSKNLTIFIIICFFSLSLSLEANNQQSFWPNVQCPRQKKTLLIQWIQEYDFAQMIKLLMINYNIHKLQSQKGVSVHLFYMMKFLTFEHNGRAKRKTWEWTSLKWASFEHLHSVFYLLV